MDRKQRPARTKLFVGCTLLMLITLCGCANNSQEAKSRPKYGSNLGKPTATHTDFATLTSRADQLQALPLTYTVGGVSIKSRNWIFAHAKSRIEYSLPAGQFSTLSFEMGLDDVSGADHGSVVYIVQGDGRELFRSSVIKPMAPPMPASVDIKGVKVLILVVDDASDGIASDEAYWIDLRGK